MDERNSTNNAQRPGASSPGAGTHTPPAAGQDSRPEQLTANFTLTELTKSSTAETLGIDNTIADDQIPNAVRLCRDLLQPVRDRFGALKVTSGHRCLEVNRAIGGATYSAHLYQVIKHENWTERKAAADLQPMAEGLTLQEMFDWIRLDSGLPFDQLILERGKDNNSESDDCIHIASTNGRQRRHAYYGPTHGDGEYTPAEVRDPSGQDDPA